MDPIGTREVFGVVRKMAEEGMTVVMVEHKVEWIAEFADRVIALKQGLILMEGKPNESAYLRPADRKRLRRFAIHLHSTRSEETRLVEKAKSTCHVG
ncbi:MAG: hypothetical protein IPG80_12420 [Anaerolineales bacterium]|uniref:hypothetical protein n=1 Tax=Candidatus Villigracilis vicinus TaxID=3140679 RepID=UPI0031367C10|nr:hypothetical protein [Anaerolineales bacterium]